MQFFHARNTHKWVTLFLERALILLALPFLLAIVIQQNHSTLVVLCIGRPMQSRHLLNLKRGMECVTCMSWSKKYIYGNTYTYIILAIDDIFNRIRSNFQNATTGVQCALPMFKLKWGTEGNSIVTCLWDIKWQHLFSGSKQTLMSSVRTLIPFVIKSTILYTSESV